MRCMKSDRADKRNEYNIIKSHAPLNKIFPPAENVIEFIVCNEILIPFQMNCCEVKCGNSVQSKTVKLLEFS